MTYCQNDSPKNKQKEIVLCFATNANKLLKEADAL